MKEPMTLRRAITIGSVCAVVATLGGVAWAWPNLICCGISGIGGSIHTDIESWANGNLSYGQRGEFLTTVTSTWGLCYNGGGNFAEGSGDKSSTAFHTLPLTSATVDEHGHVILSDVVDVTDAAETDEFFCQNGNSGNNPWEPAARTIIAMTFVQDVSITECPDKGVTCTDAQRILKRTVHRDCAYHGPLTPWDLEDAFYNPPLTQAEWDAYFQNWALTTGHVYPDDLLYDCTETQTYPVK